MQKNDQEPQEMLVLSDDIFSVDELEERLELAAGIASSCVCGANACAAKYPVCCGEDNSW